MDDAGVVEVAAFEAFEAFEAFAVFVAGAEVLACDAALEELGDFSKRDFSVAADALGDAEGDVAGAATAGSASAFDALADFAEAVGAGAVTGSAAGAAG